MKWRVGDIAIFIYTPNGKAVGKETEVLSNLYSARNDTESGEIRCGDLVHHVDYKPVRKGCRCIVRPEWLGKLPDGNQASTWDETIFKPKELVPILKT